MTHTHDFNQHDFDPDPNNYLRFFCKCGATMEIRMPPLYKPYSVIEEVDGRIHTPISTRLRKGFREVLRQASAEGTDATDLIEFANDHEIEIPSGVYVVSRFVD